MRTDSKDSGTASSEDGDNPHSHHHHLHHNHHLHHKSNRLNDSHPGSGSPSPDICDKPGGGYPLYHPAAIHHYRPTMGPSIPMDMKHTPTSSTTNPNLINKPRIWSLADMASKEEKDASGTADKQRSSPTGHYQPSGGGGPGKILSPLASRMPYPPYIKHELSKPDIYRSFNGPHAAHMAGVGHVADYALLESYQRALVAHNGLAASMHPLSSIMSVKAGDPSNPTSGGGAFAPLSLTAAAAANHHHHLQQQQQQQHHLHHLSHSTSVPSSGASPSASSTSSRPENSTPTTSHDRPTDMCSAAAPNSGHNSATLSMTSP